MFRYQFSFGFMGLCLFAMTNFAMANASFDVAPVRVTLSLQHPKTSEFIVRNTGDKGIHLHVSPQFYPITSRFVRGGTPLTADAEHSLVPYMLVSPEALSLRPGEQRTVRLSVHAPADLIPGTYRAHLLFKMLEVAKTLKSQQNNGQGDTVGTQIDLLMEMAVAIYANQGKSEPALNFSCAHSTSGRLLLTTINKTPWHFSGEVYIGYQGNRRTKQPLTVFRDTKLTTSVNWSLRERKALTLRWRSDDSTVWHTSRCQIT